MKEPLFLTLEEVLLLHAYQVEHFGGAPEVRDLRLLESAVAQAQNAWHYEQAELATVTATYLFHIVQNHPFVDGNKRTGAHAAIVFLAMNGIEADYPVDETERIVVGVASGQVPKPDVVAFFRRLLNHAL